LTIGVAYSLKDKLTMTLSTGGVSLVKSLCRLFLPQRDVQARHAMQSRLYFRILTETVSSCAVSATPINGHYYRIFFDFAREETTMRSARSLAMLVGKHGSINHLLQLAMSIQKKIEILEGDKSKKAPLSPIVSDEAKKRELLSRLESLVSVWICMTYYILGVLEFTTAAAATTTTATSTTTTATATATAATSTTENGKASCGFCGQTCEERRCTR